MVNSSDTALESYQILFVLWRHFSLKIVSIVSVKLAWCSHRGFLFSPGVGSLVCWLFSIRSERYTDRGQTGNPPSGFIDSCLHIGHRICPNSPTNLSDEINFTVYVILGYFQLIVFYRSFNWNHQWTSKQNMNCMLLKNSQHTGTGTYTSWCCT